MAVNFRVEWRGYVGNSRQDQERVGYSLIRQFKRVYDESGLLDEIRDRQFFESKSRKRRKQRKQFELQKQYDALMEKAGGRKKNKKNSNYSEGE